MLRARFLRLNTPRLSSRNGLIVQMMAFGAGSLVLRALRAHHQALQVLHRHDPHRAGAVPIAAAAADRAASIKP